MSGVVDMLLWAIDHTLFLGSLLFFFKTLHFFLPHNYVVRHSALEQRAFLSFYVSNSVFLHLRQFFVFYRTILIDSPVFLLFSRVNL